MGNGVLFNLMCCNIKKSAEFEDIDINKNIKEKFENVFWLLYCGRIPSDNERALMNHKQLSLTNIEPTEEYIFNKDGNKITHCRINTCGTYSFRQVIKNGKKQKKLSYHSFGIAIDINAESAGNPDTYKIIESDMVNTPTKIRTWEHPIVKAFLSQGFGWGIYKNRWDFMHFSYMTSPFTTNNDVTKPELVYNPMIGH